MGRPIKWIDFVHDFLAGIFAEGLRAKRVASLANGVMTSASLAVSIIGHALAQAGGLLGKGAIIKQVGRLSSNRGIGVWDMFGARVTEVVGQQKPAVVAMEMIPSVHQTDNLITGPKASCSFVTRIAYIAKRGFDIVGASVLLLLLFPLMALTAAAVTFDGGPILYLGNRVGAKGLPFKCIKFRTMIPDADHCLEEYLGHHPHARDEWLQDRKMIFDPRTTFVGKALRQSSLDELPQLLNVIKGEMSLVGPRPVTRTELDDYYRSSAELYMSVRPGMTGLWQVSGRNDVSYATRVALDESYVRDWNFALDILILCQTLGVVLSMRGAR